MRILVVGAGAREHALVWKFAAEPMVREVYCAPGNAGTGRMASNVAIAADDVEGLADWAEESKIDLTVIGQEVALAAGIVDLFRERGLRIIGPTKAAARLETSKAFAKEFMSRHGIPTAPFTLYDSADLAIAALETRGEGDFPVVLKADGLAAGKGVVVATTRAEALAAVTTLHKLPGAAGVRLLIEEFMRGTELSVFALTDGTTVLPLPPARDYKRLGQGGTGPMTGGMGAYSPPAIATPAVMDAVMKEILEPTVRGMAAEGVPYTGILYAGLMLTDRGPRVVEFNVRLGDPETQCLLPRLRSPLAPLLLAAAEGYLHEATPEWKTQACCAIVLASDGYPGPYETGYGVVGLGEVESGTLIFHAATRDPYVKPQKDVATPPQTRESMRRTFSMFSFGKGRSDRIDRQAQRAAGDPYSSTITTGGRVLTVVALGGSVAAAREAAYRNADRIQFTDRYIRPDVAADD